jgi:hypothetical protein
MSHVYQIHVDTGSASLVNPSGQATVTKVGGNPFQCTVILGNRHRRIRSLALKNAQVPVGFYNVRAPYNTMNVNSVVYTLTPGNYSVTTLLNALNTTVTSAVGAFSPGALNNNIQFSSAAGVATMNVQPLTLLSFLGFSDGQQGTAFYGSESYIVNFDTYLNIWIENLGTQSLEPAQITFKVPVTVGSGSIMHWSENTQNSQLVEVTDRGTRLDRLNIQVLDRFGNLLNNNGLDWSFTIEIEADT